MKKAIILMAALMMVGQALAHDPNDMPTNVDIRWSVSEGNIATFNIRLPDRFVKILSKLTPAQVTGAVTKMVKSWENIYKIAWFKERTDKDMGL